jgi:hypothetical protein
MWNVYMYDSRRYNTATANMVYRNAELAFFLFSTVYDANEAPMSSFENALVNMNEVRALNDYTIFIMCGVNISTGYGNAQYVHEWDQKEYEMAKSICNENSHELYLLDVRKPNDVKPLTRRIIQHLTKNPYVFCLLTHNLEK